MTAAVSQIDGKELQKMPMANISQGLAGRLPGLISVQNSGQPGADQASMTIRGAKSGILYIVDGVQRSINDIDPNDVESVSLLKDGAAVAVYGLEAAGGVMIVTTKKGRQGTMNLTEPRSTPPIPNFSTAPATPTGTTRRSSWTARSRSSRPGTCR